MSIAKEAGLPREYGELVNTVIEWRFHLPISNPQAARLVEQKNGDLKQQIELLPGKPTLAGWTKVLSQALIYLNDQPVGPVDLYARLGMQAEVPNTVKV